MGGSEKVQNYADVIYGLARMDAARLRMLEDTDDLRTMQKEKQVILFIKSRRSLFYFVLFYFAFIHSSPALTQIICKLYLKTYLSVCHGGNL